MKEFNIGSAKKKIEGKTFYFHDYETFGINPMLSQATQFAGIRTDEDLNIIEGTELNIYCKVRDDQLPSPMACIVTNLTPKRIETKESSVLFSEYDFTKRVMKEMSYPNTCNIGYNNINFDDEWSRNLSYRNFLDPYEREWKNGCSRADGINFIQAVWIYNPNILNFPQAKDKETGELLFDKNNKPLPSFKLEDLSAANGIIHENAHDALSDVIALIGLLKIIKEKDSFLFNYVLSLKDKNKVSQDLFNYKESMKPFLHISSFYGKKNNSSSVAVVIGKDKANKNQFIVFDLKEDPEKLLLDANLIRDNIFSKSGELDEKGESRIGLKTIAINKCANYLDLSLIKNRAEDLGLSKNSNLYKENLIKLKEIMSRVDIQAKLDLIYESKYEKPTDPDISIYGGFPSKKDVSLKETVNFYLTSNNLDGLGAVNFDDSRLNELLIRFKARNFPESLNQAEKKYWSSFVRGKLFDEIYSAEYSYSQFIEEIDDLKLEFKDNEDVLLILDELLEYSEKIKLKYK